MIVSKLFSLKVLGAFDLFDQQGRSIRPTGRKDSAILAILALTRNHRQTRTWLQDKLWGDRGPAQGAASLRQALTTLRGILNTNEEILQADRTWVWLNPDKISFDHQERGASGEILRGFDLRDEGFNDWLRETRVGFELRKTRWAGDDKPEQPDRRWYVDAAVSQGDSELCELGEVIVDGLSEALSVIGVFSAIDRRLAPEAPPPRASDLVVKTRIVRVGTGCLFSLQVTDGFGTLRWHVRRESDRHVWSSLQSIQNELVQLFQDFVIRTEANSLKGARWSAHSNGCQALMGMLLPGTLPLKELVDCSENALAADEQGIYHALLGYTRLLRYGERESFGLLDAEYVMQSFRTALQKSPNNALVQALAGHSFGFLKRDLGRNADLTKEAVRGLPGNAICWTYFTISQIYSGRFKEALSAAQKAIYLSKGTMIQPMARVAQQFALLMSGEFEKAICVGEVTVDEIAFRPSIMNLMTAYSLAGRVEDGRSALNLLIEREPDLSIDLIRSEDYPIVNSTHRDITIQALGQLGLH